MSGLLLNKIPSPLRGEGRGEGQLPEPISQDCREKRQRRPHTLQSISSQEEEKS